MSLNSDLSLIANDLTALYKKVVKDKGLVSTGKMLNSIKWKVKDNNLTMEAEDYFNYVDKKNGISTAVFATTEYQKILTRIAEAIAKDIVS